MEFAVFVNAEFYPVSRKLLVDLLLVPDQIIHSATFLKQKGMATVSR